MLEGREWFPQPGASAEVLNTLKSVAPVELPESYYRLLAFSDGGEGPLPVSPFNLCLDPAQMVVDAIRSGNSCDADLTGFLVCGSNGGGEYVAFDLRGEGHRPVVCIDMIVGAESAEQIARDFDELLSMIGVE